MPTTIPRYRELADRISTLIREGTFPAGSRLPSLRRTSREQRVSITTVLEAYERLVDQRLIESRERSGYFVCAPQVSKSQLPLTSRTISRPARVKRPNIFQTVMESIAIPNIVPFGAAVPDSRDMPAPKLASTTNAVLRRLGPSAFRYTMSPGRKELRTALARRFLSAGIDVIPDNVVTTLGATEAVSLALKAATKSGDLIAIESPTYYGILPIIRDYGLRVIEIPVLARDGIDLAKLESVAAKHPIKACLVQPSFQNPVGSCMREDAKRQLIHLARQFRFTVIEDDLYGELAHSGSRPRALASFDKKGHVIHCGSFSKILSPGLRVGWICGGRHHEKVSRIKAAHFPANSTLSEMVVAEFLQEGGFERHLRKLRTRYADRCHTLREAILANFDDGTRVSYPGGGFVLWVDMPQGFDSEEFARRAQKRNISIIPGTIFSPTCGLRNYFRISCASPIDDRSLDAVDTLARLARSLC